jgi:hypothetical protein
MKTFLLNTGLTVVSIFAAYALMELLFRFAMPALPMALFNNECRELRTIGQSSKREKTPSQPYIAILGDSYGAGQGDWFISNNYNPNSRYQATHVLQSITGQDVVSLSRAGAGNYDGAAIYAINTWRYLNNNGFDFEAPGTIIVYFYEGNDISDNLQFLSRHFEPKYDISRLNDDEYFALFSKEMDTKFCQGTLPRLQDKFLVGNLLSRYVEGILYSATRNRRPTPPGTRYEAIISGKNHQLPDTLETDLTQYPAEHIENSCRLFDRTLVRLNEVWPDAQKFVTYIPSPLTIYSFRDDNAVARVDLSNSIEKQIMSLSAQHNFTFIDFTPVVRHAAQTQLLHGPKDWNHFNKAGYELLGATLAQALSAESAY